MGWWPFSKKGDASGAPAAPAPAAAAPGSDAKPKKKICCACPDTKRLRDECIAMRGEEAPYCAALIAAHKECLRLEGFNV